MLLNKDNLYKTFRKTICKGYNCFKNRSICMFISFCHTCFPVIRSADMALAKFTSCYLFGFL